MALGNDLLMGALIIGGGYIFIYHVLPGLQTGNFAGGGGGTFLPPVAATGETKCWEIGNGKRACSCQGKQHFVMGELRQCPDCYTHCATGATPDLKRPTSNPTAPKQVGPTPTPTPTPTNPSLSRCTAQTFSQNCIRNTACQYCWFSSGKSACTNVASCTAARSTWLARHSSGPTNVPPTRPTTGPASGTQRTWRCVKSSITKKWVCRDNFGNAVTQPATWACNGALASRVADGASCTTIR